MMERRKAFATAGAVSVTALAAVVALGANMGLFGLAKQDDGPGTFRLVDNVQQSPSPVRTEVVDVPVAVPDAAPAAAPSRGSSSPPPTARSSAPSVGSTAAAATPAPTAAPAPTTPRREPADDGFEPGDGADD